jgi:hypothetical protein
MKVTQTLVLSLLLILGLAGLALGRDMGTSDRNGGTPAASYGRNSNNIQKGHHARGRHHRHRRGRWRYHRRRGMRM